jgi:hypothetical protein
MIDSVKCLDAIRARWRQTSKYEEVYAMTSLAYHFNGIGIRPGDGRLWTETLRGFREKCGCHKVSDPTLGGLLDLLDKGGVFKCNSSA